MDQLLQVRGKTTGTRAPGNEIYPRDLLASDDHYLTNQYQTQKKYKNPKKYQQDRNCKKMFVNKRAIYLKFTVRVWKLVTS